MYAYAVNLPALSTSLRVCPSHASEVPRVLAPTPPLTPPPTPVPSLHHSSLPAGL